MLKKNNLIFAAYILLASLVCLISAVLYTKLITECSLELNISSQSDGYSQIYWRKSSQSFSENNSLRLPLRASKSIQKLTFNIGSPFIDEIRVDPIDKNSPVYISSIKLSTALETKELKALARAGQQVEKIVKENTVIKILTEGNDPQLLITYQKHKFWLCVVLAIGLFAVTFLCCQAKKFARRFDCHSEPSDFKATTLCLLFLAFFCAVILKLNGSSVAIWHKHYSHLMPEKGSLLSGEAHSVRSDEWLVHTPGIVSQYHLNFSTENSSYGSKMSPLLMGLPTNHFSTIFRPQYWGFFLFDIERAFSWWWNYRVFCCLIGVFLLASIFTGNKAEYALLACIWYYGSPFTQWWLSSGVPELVGNMCLSVYTIYCLFISSSKIKNCLAALSCLLFSLSFCLQIYPPFQVPLAWLAIFCLLTFISDSDYRKKFLYNIKLKLFLSAMLFIGIGSVLYLFLIDLYETSAILAATSYPGQRTENGGNLNLARLLLGCFSFINNEKNFPLIFGNISEAGNFLIIWPLALLMTLSKKMLQNISALILFSLLLISYCFIGWHGFFSKISLMSFVPASRTQIALGFSSILIVVYALSRAPEGSTNQRVSNHFELTDIIKRYIFSGLFLGMLLLGSVLLLEKNFGSYLNFYEYVFNSLILILLIASLFKFRKLFFALIIIISLSNILSVNPINSGLMELTDNKVSLAARNLEQSSKSKKMIVYGDFILPSLFKAAGFNVINGANYVPNLSYWLMLDPDKRFYDIYNRYAHFFYQPRQDQSLEMNLIQADLAMVSINPCSEKLTKAGIELIAIPESLYHSNFSCLQKIDLHIPSVSIYRLR